MKNVKSEKYTLQDLDYGKKPEKTWKMRHKHCMTWNMARKLKNMENETHTHQELEYGEKPEKRGK